PRLARAPQVPAAAGVRAAPGPSVPMANTCCEPSALRAEATALPDRPRDVHPVRRGLTVTATAAELLSAKPPLPVKVAVSVWLPTPRDTGRGAWPLLSSCAVPSTVLPALKVTVPVGVPAGEVTSAGSTSGAP